MIVAITSEYHFVQTHDGIYTDATYPYAYWAGFLEVFDEVIVVARAARADAPRGLQRVDGARVRVAVVREFVGTRGLGAGALSLGRVALQVARHADVAILRVPGVVGTALHAALALTRRRYGVEVVGDPRESLAGASGAIRALASIAQGQLARQVRGAVASLFVTQRALQDRYPPRAGTLTVAMSNVELPDALFARPPVATVPGAALRLIFVGTLAQPYKGLDVLLDALATTQHSHTLTIVGDGVLRPALALQAERLGLAGRVRFVGMVPPAEVYAHLAAADLFVLPSRTEGMPRALIEAMAVGLPCLATPVGGVPELLPADAQVPVGDAAQLAAAIDKLAADPATRQRHATRNRAAVAPMRASEATEVRRRFRTAVRAAAEGR